MLVVTFPGWKWNSGQLGADLQPQGLRITEDYPW